MSEKRQQEEALFEAARNLNDPAQCRAFLDQACAGDVALRQRVEALLAAQTKAERFFNQSVSAASSSSVETEPQAGALNPTVRIAPLEEEQAGTVIGRYKLREKVGEGGCGVVYVAEQIEPVRRRVALKVIKLGMDTKQVVARFEAERQALALMDHPNIAKVLDAGATETGRPYFVMELVRGIRITEYCDQSRMTTQERLELFIKVCRAIQHAHQKGIIHRDIKPSNILITLHDGVPVPKVIDFGIAKATEGRLTDATVYTELHQFIGTPAYMSPEQAEMSGLDIDTRSDIYSLGVLLYELLTGRTPFDPKELAAQGIDVMRRTIREQEPPRPSTRLSILEGEELTTTARSRSVDPPRLAHLLRGDLDWIVMKCLEKDRTRRYETANGLAMDLQRHLDDEPVVARPPSKLYEFRKTVRRHKAGFAATAAVILVLACGIALTSWQAVRATHAEQKAQTEAARSAQVAQFMKDMLKGVGPSVALGRDTELLREILDQTAGQLDKLRDQPEVEADLLNTLGTVYRDLSDYARAEDLLQQALKLRRQLHPGDHPDVASSIHNLATVYYFQLRNPEARASFEEALAMRRRLFGDENVQVADSLYGLAEVLRREGATRAEAEKAHKEALAIRRKLLGNVNVNVARSLTGLGILLRNVGGRSADSEDALREALKIQRQLWSDEHPEVAYTLQNLGYTVWKAGGRRAEAEDLLRQTVAMQKRLLGNHRDTAMSIQFLATIVTNQSEALQLHREALEMRRKMLGDHPDTSSSVMKLVDALQAQGELKEAADVLRDQIAWLRGQSGEHSAALNDLRIQLVTTQAGLGKPEAVEEVLSLLDRQPWGGNAEALDPWKYNKQGETMQKQQKLAGARVSYEVALRLFCRQPVNGTDDGLLSALEWTLRNRRDWPGLEGLFQKCLLDRRAFLAKEDPSSNGEDAGVGFLLYGLAKVSAAQDRSEKAEDYRHKAFRILSEGNATNVCTFKLAAMVREEGDLEMAIRFARQSLRVRAKARSEWVLHPLCLAASLLQQLGKPDEARKLVRQGVGLWKEYRAAGAMHANLPIDNLLSHLLRQGMTTDAEMIAREAAEDGNASPMNTIAWLFATAPDALVRDGERAVKYAKLAVAATGRKEAAILDTLAAAYAEAGDFTNAVRVQEEAIALVPSNGTYELKARLRLYQSGLAYRDPGALASQVLLLLRAGNFAEAESIARACLKLRKIMIPDHWLTFNTMSMLGGALLGQKKYADAEPLLLSGYEGMKQREESIPPAGKVRLTEAVERQVRFYEATGQMGTAAEWKKKLKALNPPALK